MYEKHNYHQLTGHNLTDAVRRAIEYEQHAAFVESLCAALNDTRSGSEPETEMTGVVNDWLAANTVFCDLTAEVASYTFIPDSEMAHRYSNEIICHQLQQINRKAASVHTNPLSPLILGRGSP